MLDPRSVTPGSIMPVYTWLYDQKIEFDGIQRRFEVMKSLGVPYTDEQVRNSPNAAREEAKAIAESLSSDSNVKGLEQREIVALIAYLQRLGKNPELLKSNSAAGDAP
jgi:cytochrome c oxidase cbb3-type subunit I/II